MFSTCWLPATLALIALTDATSILFVGNSFTHVRNSALTRLRLLMSYFQGKLEPAVSYYAANITDANGSGYGGVPGIFKHLATTAGLNYSVTIEAVGGQTLAYHAANRASIINQAGWDVVVFQEYSTLPVPTARGGDPTLFAEGLESVVQLVKSNNPNASIYLYETWSRPDQVYPSGTPYYSEDIRVMQVDLHDSYDAQSSIVEATGVASVGDSFIKAIDAGVADGNPYDGIDEDKIDLWASDHYHASVYGSYLSAVSIFSKVTSIDPTTIPNDEGTAAAGLGISSSVASSLQAVICP